MQMLKCSKCLLVKYFHLFFFFFKESIRNVIKHTFLLSHMIWGINYVHAAQTMWEQTLIKSITIALLSITKSRPTAGAQRVWLQDSLWIHSRVTEAQVAVHVRIREPSHSHTLQGQLFAPNGVDSSANHLPTDTPLEPKKSSCWACLQASG